MALDVRDRIPPAESGLGLTPAQQARMDMRRNRFTAATTRNVALGHVQAAVVVVPRDLAFEFLAYCQRNQRPCQVLEVLDPGDPEPRFAAPGGDIRTDIALYNVYRNGELVDQSRDIVDLWQDDSVGYLLGSNTSVDLALNRAGVQTTNHRWVLRTSTPTVPAGRFHGPLSVTMRWLTPAEVIKAVQVTSRFPFNHGAPIHIGDPAELGCDLQAPMSGAPPGERPAGLVPVFWACSMTPLLVAEASKVDLMITSAPSKLFITDILSEAVSIP